MTPQDPSSPYIRAGTPYTTTVDLFNNTGTVYSSLKYIVKKQSPTGVEEIVKEQTLDIPAGGYHTDTVTFSESETGPWKLIAVAGENSAAQSEILLVVAEPVVTMEILAPQYAGNEPVEIKIQLANTGNIDTSLAVRVQAPGGTVPVDEHLTLTAGEERILTFSDTLTADRSYTVSMTGDVTKSETLTVQYGCKENFNIDVQPIYREGPVIIGYTLGNTGGLTYSGNVHGELYALGSTVPLYVFDRSYNLFHLTPGDSPVSDSFSLNLAPGNYQLKYNTTGNPTVRTAEFTVQPNGIGTVVFTRLRELSTYPAGFNTISYSLSNSDTVAGVIAFTITVAPEDAPQTPVFSENRSIYIQPGQTIKDVIAVELIQPGNYKVNITGAKLTAPVIETLRIVTLDSTAASLSIGAIDKGNIPVEAIIDNSGYYDFNGIVSIDVQPDDIHYEEAVTVTGGSSATRTIDFSTLELTPGEKTVKAVVYDAFRSIVSETSGNVTVLGADIHLTDLPENLVIEAGSYVDVPMKLVNQGHQRGEILLELTAFNNLYQEREIALEPGQELHLEDIQVDAPHDMTSGYYQLNYTLTDPADPANNVTGHIDFKVNSLEMDVSASLDRSLYNVGETALLTLTVTTAAITATPLEAVVNWGKFNEHRSFDLSTGSAVMTFNIPLEEQLDSKISYGIYHEEGKGIHLNDIYLNFRGDVSVELDKQIYSPGDIVLAVFTSEQAGILTATAFGESYTVNLSSSASASFQIPQNALGGTYGVGWEFTPADTASASLSGNQPFDVGGLVVKMVKSQLEKDRYAPEETIKADFLFESNQDDSLELRVWVIAPSGHWEYMGPSDVTVSGQIQTITSRAHSFNTTEAGTHKWVYALYKHTTEDELLVLSGHNSFEVGDAILTGITTDRFEYKAGNESVTVTIDHFGQGSAQLELLLDDVKIAERSVSLNGGVSSTLITLDGSQVGGGSHGLTVRLKKDGLTSTRSTGFLYGTSLPDLTVQMPESTREGTAYTYKVSVVNSGRTASPDCSLVFSDNGAAVQTFTLPALQPGASQEQTFTWNGSGKAGSHEFVFEADSGNTVKEYSESNNQLTINVEVPVMFYSLEVEPLTWPANSEITMITRLINNQDSAASLLLDLSITNDSSGEVIFQHSKTEQVPAFGSKSVSDSFNTGVYPAGSYSVSQTLSGDNVALEEYVSVYIEATKALTSTLELLPPAIPDGVDSDVVLTMNLNNTGNVDLQDEVLVIEVFHKESETVVNSEEISVSLPLAGTAVETHTLRLNLLEGNYEIRLKFMEEMIASAPLAVVGGIKLEKTVSIQPRLMLMDLHSTGRLNRNYRLEYLAGLLQAQGIEFQNGQGSEDSFLKLRQGYSNITVILGNLGGRKLWDELKERVRGGEGLIIVPDKSYNSRDWREFPGVTVKPVPDKQREQTFSLRTLPPLVNSGADVELAEKNKLQIEKVNDDVVVIGETVSNKFPVITYRKYGKGHILVLAVPVDSGGSAGGLARLLLDAAVLFSGDIYTGSDLTRLLPVQISFSNESGTEEQVTVKELLPYGVEGFDYNPQPVSGDELKWELTIPASSVMYIRYWLKLPDRIDAYEIKTETYDGDTRLDEISLDLEVSQVLLSRLDEIIVELESLTVSPADAKWINNAIRELQQVRDRGTGQLLQLINNLNDSTAAADHLSQVSGTDVSLQRQKIIDIIRIYGRQIYETIVAAE
jgi:hypothetical protein